MTIPEIAVQKVNKMLSQANENNSRTIFVMGSKSVGKTTLIYSFLDKTDNPRETLALEYFYSRKTNQIQGVEKIICHLWEYGGSGKLTLLKNVLPSIPFRGKCYFCTMLDLSKIKSLWDTLETSIKTINEGITNIGITADLIIICGKYDLFKNYDNEFKKHICITLRSVALLYDAHLLFYSHKEPQLVKRAKDMFHNIAFGSNDVVHKEKNVTNYTKPLLITKGTDSWESIGISASTFEQIKVRHISRFIPEINEEVTSTAEAVVKNYPEPTLDSLAALKMEELYQLISSI